MRNVVSRCSASPSGQREMGPSRDTCTCEMGRASMGAHKRSVDYSLTDGLSPLSHTSSSLPLSLSLCTERSSHIWMLCGNASTNPPKRLHVFVIAFFSARHPNMGALQARVTFVGLSRPSLDRDPSPSGSGRAARIPDCSFGIRERGRYIRPEALAG